ncbi:DUF2752 domain-containing protein [Streptomyces sp. NPDC054784]
MSDPTGARGWWRRPAGPRAAYGPGRGPLVRLAAPVAALVATAAAVGFVGAVDPSEPGHYPACPLLSLTGVLCPGCGGLRAAHAVAHGDAVAALGANALVAVAFPALAVLWLCWVRAVLRRRPVVSAVALLPVPPRAVHGWVLGGLVLVFTVVRNLPFGAGLAP